jgi:hypothetical protein
LLPPPRSQLAVRDGIRAKGSAAQHIGTIRKKLTSHL